MSRWIRVVLVSVLFSVVSAPAWGDERDLTLSWDGQRWGSSLHGALFDPRAVWVPGDVRTGGFLVRSGATAVAELAIVVESQESGRVLATEAVRLESRVDGGEWVDLLVRGRVYVLGQVPVRADSVAEVEVRATMDPAAGNDAQARSTALAFGVFLRDARVVAGLPGTGAPGVRGLVLLATVLVGVGLGCVRRGRGGEGASHG